MHETAFLRAYYFLKCLLWELVWEPGLLNMVQNSHCDIWHSSVCEWCHHLHLSIDWYWYPTELLLPYVSLLSDDKNLYCKVLTLKLCQLHNYHAINPHNHLNTWSKHRQYIVNAQQAHFCEQVNLRCRFSWWTHYTTFPHLQLQERQVTQLLLCVSSIQLHNNLYKNSILQLFSRRMQKLCQCLAHSNLFCEIQHEQSFQTLCANGAKFWEPQKNITKAIVFFGIKALHISLQLSVNRILELLNDLLSL